MNLIKTVSYNADALISETNQTILDTELREYFSNLINDNKDYTTLIQIYNYICDNYTWGDNKRFERSVNEIIESQSLSGCNDCGLLFATILRIKEIPTVYLRTGEVNWISKLVNNENGKNSIHGHNFLEVLIDGKFVLLDATNAKVYENYDVNNLSLPRSYYVFSKSLDLWETGVVDMKSNHELMIDVFKDFKLEDYKNPGYNPISLCPDKRIKESTTISR